MLTRGSPCCPSYIIIGAINVFLQQRFFLVFLLILLLFILSDIMPKVIKVDLDEDKIKAGCNGFAVYYQSRLKKIRLEDPEFKVNHDPWGGEGGRNNFTQRTVKSLGIKL